MQHPDDKQLQFFVAGQLDAEKEKTIEEHLARCPECTKRISELERLPQDPLMQEVKAAVGANSEVSSQTIDYQNRDISSETVDFTARRFPSGSSDNDLFTGGDVLGGNLRLEEKLGRGGMGEAWKASDLMAGRDVVIKLVPPEIRHAEVAMEQVRETFQKVHALQHQHICPMMSLNDDPTYGLYVVMKFINGKTLDAYRKDYIGKHGRFPLSEILRILWDVARALDYSHERKVLHRDVKPQNIMVSPEDGVQLIDFGLAAEIRSSMMQFSETPMDIAGTRPYMAPEQWRGRLQDAKTDQYALAVTAYELIAGRQPFVGTDVTVLRECVLNEDPEPIPGIPEHINAALAKAMSKKRDDRFSDCRTFVRALNTKPTASTENAEPSTDVAQNRSEYQETIVMPPPVVETTPKKSKRRTNVWTLVFGVAACAALLGLFGFLSSKPPQRPNVVAQSEMPKQEKVPDKPVEPTPEPEKAVPVEEVSEPAPSPLPELLKLTDDEKRSLQEKYPELDWKDANVVVLPEPTENALRQALEKAAETPENDFIVVRTTKEKHRIVLENGAFEIQGNYKDQGRFAIISLGPEKLILDGNKKDRVFHVKDSAKIDFAGIVFTNGFVVDDRGGAVHARRSTTRFFHCDFIGNVCKARKKTGWYEDFSGAGLGITEGNLVLHNIMFEKNQVDFHDVVEGKRVHGTGYAAGLIVANGRLIATDVVFRNNDGSAIFAYTSHNDNRLHNISVIGNKTLRGDVVHFMNDHSEQHTYTITNFLATGNTCSSDNDDHGVLHLRGKGRFLLDHVTIVDNSCASMGSGIVITGNMDRGGIPSEVTLSNSIIAGNRRKGADRDSNFEIKNEDKVGKLNIFNCITSDGPAEFGKDRNNLVVSRDDLKFGELKDFGNGVPVMPLLEGSPAIDAGTVTDSVTGNAPKTDITGRPRNVGKAPDIGAFEYQENAVAAAEEVAATVEKPAGVDAWQPTEAELAEAPEDCKKYLKTIADRIKEKGGYVIAGRVSIDGKPPASPMDFDVRMDSFVSRRFSDGWFCSGPATAFAPQNTKQIRAWAAQTDKLETSMICDPNKINFVNIHLRKADDDKLVYLTGKVVDEDEKPITNARVTAYCTSLIVPNTLESVTTDRGGKYRFAIKVFPHIWSVTATSPAGLDSRSTIQTDPIDAKDVVIYHPRKVVIDSVFQPDGSTDFSKGNVIMERYELWTNGPRGVAKGNTKVGSQVVFDPAEKGHEADIGLHFYPSGKLEFVHGYQNSTSHGHYALGKANFDSVKEAVPANIQKSGSACELNHVYVVRTYKKGLYAKFVVRSINVIVGATGDASQTPPVVPLPVPTEKPKPVEKPAGVEAWQPTEEELAAAPVDFKTQLKKVENDIKKKGGFAVAGQLVEENGEPIKLGTFSVALKSFPGAERDAPRGTSLSTEDTYRYENGWFVTRQISDVKYNNFVAATFQHGEVEVPLTIEPGKISFQRVFVKRVPEEKLATLQGMVQDEKGRPLADAEVKLILSRAIGYIAPKSFVSVVTNSEGMYSISGVAPQAYELSIGSKRLPNSSESCTVYPDEDRTALMLDRSRSGFSRQENDKIVSTLPFTRRVVIDAVYQPDGSTDFGKANVRKDQYTLELFGSTGLAKGNQKTGHRITFDPTAKGTNNDSIVGEDLRLNFSKGKCEFRHIYINENDGHYDLGAVDFDAVKEADPARIDKHRSSPCELNHVHVVRTYQKGHYAKFIVRSIEVVEPAPPIEKPKPAEARQPSKKQTFVPAAAWKPTPQELAAAPSEFQKRGKEIQTEIEKNGGFAVAGQVVEKNGQPMRYGTYTVALKYNEGNADDTYRFANGWFITQVQKSSKYDTIVAATFLHDEVEAPLNIEEGKINFCRVLMERTPKSKLATFRGVVQDENGRPIAGAEVEMTVDRSNGYFESPLSTKTATDAGGRYSFSGMTSQEYSVTVSSKRSYVSFETYPGADETKLVLVRSYDGLSRQDGERIVSTVLFPRKVTIDTVYQPDGSTDFSGENVVTGRYVLVSAGSNGIAMGDQKIGRSIIFDPNTEKSKWGYYEDDLRLRTNGGKCSFSYFYVNDKVGHYDLGAVDFSSVKEADPARIKKQDSPCKLNHVYVARTYQKGHYVKFVVRSIDIMGTPAAGGSQEKTVEKKPAPEEEVAEEEEEEETDPSEQLLLKDLPISEEDSQQRRRMRWATFSSSQKKYENSLFASVPSKQIFRPGKQWKTFKARFGLAKGSANCTFIVNGDGRELYRSPVVQDQKALPLVVKIQDVDVLELVVERSDDSRKSGLAYWFTPTLSQNDTLQETPKAEPTSPIINKAPDKNAAQRIAKALEKNIDLKLDENTTFEELFAMIIEKNPGINFAIDPQGAGVLGISPKSPVVRETVKFNGITLRSALRLILNEQDLTCVVVNDVLLITSEDHARNAGTIDETPMPEAAKRRISKALDKPLDLELDENTTFAEFINMITEKNPELNVALDPRGAGALGITRSSPVVRKPAKYTATTLRNALLSILREQELVYSITDEVLLITSEYEAKKR